MNISRVVRGLKKQRNEYNLNLNPAFLSKSYKPITTNWLLDSYLEVFPKDEELMQQWYEGGAKIFGFHFTRIFSNNEEFKNTKSLIKSSLEVVDNSLSLNKLRCRGILVEHLVDCVNRDTGEFHTKDRELIIRVWLSLCSILYYGNLEGIKKKPQKAIVVTIRNVFRRMYGSFEIKHSKDIVYSQLHKINKIIKMFDDLHYIHRSPIVSNYNSLDGNVENTRKKYLVCRKGVMSKSKLNELAMEKTNRWIQRVEESKLQLTIYE